MTLLATVVDTSRRVATTSARSAKIRLLADGLRALDAEELEIAVLYLSGEVRQARLPANRTAVVMLTEVVFASLSAVALGGGTLTARLALGGAFIVVSAVLAAREPGR